MLALAATFFLDWPVSEDEGSASASAAAATSLSPSPPVEVELPPRQLALRLRVDQLVLHRLPPRVQACVSMDWWPNDKCDYGDCPWQNASLLTVDLADPLLLAAVKVLALALGPSPSASPSP